jgi:hypothetical protein
MLSGLSSIQRTKRSVMRLMAVSKSQTRRALLCVVVRSGTEDICLGTVAENGRSLRSNNNVNTGITRVATLFFNNVSQVVIVRKDHILYES